MSITPAGTTVLEYSLAWVCSTCSTAFPIAVGKGGVIRKAQPLYENGKRIK